VLRHRHNQLGFTMIELMIGVAILAILFSVAAPSFQTWIQNTQLRTAAESISNGLQLARAEAVRRNTNVIFSLNGATNVDSSWTVACATPVADLTVAGIADCPGPGLSAPLKTFIQSHSGSEGTANASVSTNNPDYTVTFSGLGRASYPISSMLKISIANTTGGTCQFAGGTMRCLDVFVATGGQILMCKASTSTTPPTPCN